MTSNSSEDSPTASPVVRPAHGDAARITLLQLLPTILSGREPDGAPAPNTEATLRAAAGAGLWTNRNTSTQLENNNSILNNSNVDTPQGEEVASSSNDNDQHQSRSRSNNGSDESNKATKDKPSVARSGED